VHERAQYAGNIFRTEASQTGQRHDDAHLRWDYKQAGRLGVISAFATIRRIFVHSLYPGGPSRVIVQGEWFTVVGKCPIAHTMIVKDDSRNEFNLHSRFVFLDNCYQQPVAVWPHDPLGQLPDEDPKKGYYDVVDRNQLEDFE